LGKGKERFSRNKPNANKMSIFQMGMRCLAGQKINFFRSLNSSQTESTKKCRIDKVSHMIFSFAIKYLFHMFSRADIIEKLGDSDVQLTSLRVTIMEI